MALAWYGVVAEPVADDDDNDFQVQVQVIDFYEELKCTL